MEILKQQFFELVAEYVSDQSITAELWSEIEKAYTHKKRHYHILLHLENLLFQLNECKDLIADWNVVLFSLYYHDVIYNASRGNNEEKSADLAEKRMTQISVPLEQIEKCKIQILATKSHQAGDDLDTNLFTDADLSILGFDWSFYKLYTEQVRQEYSIYPDLLYKPGRKKVLQHFLAMERIFKIDFFYDKFETQARLNLQQEIETL